MVRGAVSQIEQETLSGEVVAEGGVEVQDRPEPQWVEVCVTNHHATVSRITLRE